MKYEILFLKLVICIVAILFLVLYTLGLSNAGNELGDHYPLYITCPTLILMYVAGVPFYFALYNTFRLLGLVNKNETFSESAIKALKHIKYSLKIMSIILIIILPFLYIIAQFDDAPGILAFGILITGVSIVITVFVSLIKRIFENAQLKQ
jgi:hypothetical protein